MDVDIEVPPDGENICCISRSSTPIQSPASALSNLLSMIGHATKPVLTDIVKRHNVQFQLETNREVLRTLIASHLSYNVADAAGNVRKCMGTDEFLRQKEAYSGTKTTLHHSLKFDRTGQWAH
jgi:hypothetical protein